MSPVLVIGTHCSGASLLTGLLREIGLFVGYDVNRRHEASFFSRRNQQILRSCNGGWDTPGAADALLRHPPIIARVAETLADDLASASALTFLGPRRFAAHRTPVRLRAPWAFSCPLTTVLLPIWLEVFPDARVLHVYRNGVDVARSMALREERRLDRVLDGMPTAALRGRRRPPDVLLQALRGVRRLGARAESLRRYEPLRVHRCLDIQEGYSLWVHYLAKAFEFTKGTHLSVMHLRYEDFLANPDRHLRDAAEHCGLRPTRAEVDAVTARVDRRRRFPFVEDAEAMDLYREVRHSPWMKRLGYDELVADPRTQSSL